MPDHDRARCTDSPHTALQLLQVQNYHRIRSKSLFSLTLLRTTVWVGSRHTAEKIKQDTRAGNHMMIRSGQRMQGLEMRRHRGTRVMSAGLTQERLTQLIPWGYRKGNWDWWVKTQGVRTWFKKKNKWRHPKVKQTASREGKEKRNRKIITVLLSWPLPCMTSNPYNNLDTEALTTSFPG